MRRCSRSAPKTCAPGPRKSSAPPTCPKSALSPLPLIRQLPPRPTTRIRDEKCYASGASRHQPSLGAVEGPGLVDRLDVAGGPGSAGGVGRDVAAALVE